MFPKEGVSDDLESTSGTEGASEGASYPGLDSGRSGRPRPSLRLYPSLLSNIPESIAAEGDVTGPEAFGPYRANLLRVRIKGEGGCRSRKGPQARY